MPYLPSRQLWVDSTFVDSDLVNMQVLYNAGVPLHCKKYHKLAALSELVRQYPTSREREHYYGREALDKDVIYYGQMGLCGMFALSLAIAEKYDKIYLLGFDFGSASIASKNTHWYQSRIPELNITSTGAGRPEVYLLPEGDPHKDKPRREVQDFTVYAKTEGVKIYNVSLNSHIDCFEKLSYKDFFTLIENDKNNN
jgi:hypothetical protein